MAGKYGTSHPESEIILAVGDGDFAHAEALMQDMLPGELNELRVTCGRAINLALTITLRRMT